MRNTELIIFVLVVLINGGIALWKKYAELKAKRAAEALARPGAMARTSAPRPAPAAGQPAGAGFDFNSWRYPESAPQAKPKPKPKSTPKSTPKPRPKAPAKSAPKSSPRPAPKARSVPPVAEVADRRPVEPDTRAASRSASVALAARRAAPVVARLPEATGARLIVGRRGLRRAMVLREVLGPPRALAPWQA
jgi:outer membrane biosynthesis protein TonB